MPKKILIYAALLTALLAGASCSPATVTVATTHSTTVTQPGVTSVITATVTRTGPTVTVTAPAATATTSAMPTTPTATPATTAGQLSAAGAARYEASCTQTYCHAKFGEGGEDDFSQFRLSYFTDAGDMFNFTKSFMHTPDTQLFLTDQQYLEVIAFLLLQNKTVQENTPFSLSNLSAVKFGGSPGAAGTTAGSLATGGLLRYNDSCAQTYCHEKWDEGGKNDFARTRLSYFTDAQDMLNFIRSFMHHPDTKQELTDEQYLQVLAYILTQNGTVTANTDFGMADLPNISLK